MDHRSRPHSPFSAPIPAAAFFATVAMAMRAESVAAQTPPAEERSAWDKLTNPNRDAPKLEVGIPTVQFTEITPIENGEKLAIPYLAEYITGVYAYAITIATVVAASMMVIGGFQYVTSGGDAGKVKAAKERIMNAIMGVLLTLGAYLILQTVNPALVDIQPLKVQRVETEPLPTVAELQQDPADIDTSARGDVYCKSVADCAEKCKTKDSAPESFGKTVPENTTVLIPDSAGLKGNNKRGSQKTVDGLIAAGKLADKDGYTISVYGGWRPFRQQLNAICKAIEKGDTKTLGSSIAWPGGSNHGSGEAVDVRLIENKTKRIVVGSNSCSRQNSSGANGLAAVDMSQRLDRYITGAGGVRYANEIWHYEFPNGAPRACRCKYPDCPSPPMSCKGNCDTSVPTFIPPPPTIGM